MKQSEKSERTRSRILAAAMEEFGTNGYGAAMINAVCRQGINKGLLYHHFKGKEDLYLACLSESVEKLLAWIQEKNAQDSLDAYLAARLSFCDAFPHESRVLYEALLSPALALYEKITEMLKPISAINDALFAKTLDGLTLREGVTRQKAMEYFSLLERMFNSYFASPAVQQLDLPQRIALHEKTAPLMLEGMLFGIAKKDDGTKK